MTRDPRVDPRPGDVLDDDPPLPPLLVYRTNSLDVVGAARYEAVPGHPENCRCDGCACVWNGTWPLADWRRDMAVAEVLYVVGEDGVMPPCVIWERAP